MYSCFSKAALFVARSTGQTTFTLKHSPTSLGQPGGWLLILSNEVGVMLAPPYPLTKESQTHKIFPVCQHHDGFAYSKS